MRTYQIVNAKGLPKDSWEEINCDYVIVERDLVMFMDGNDIEHDQNRILIVYKLAEGEAVLFIGED